MLARRLLWAGGRAEGGTHLVSIEGDAIGMDGSRVAFVVDDNSFEFTLSFGMRGQA
jgi:hypothetical protein